jgi:hypothetical protein
VQPGVALWILARPRGAALITSLPLIGFGYALWERGSTVSPLVVARELALLTLAWLCGHAGAMWLNAALDRDRGPVLLGRAVEVPRITSAAGYAALALSVAIAIPLGAIPIACTIGCAILAILYSHPKVALKGRSAAGPLVNVIGYGALSPIAGYFSDVHAIATWRAAISLALMVAWILGIYFAAQAFQADEDGKRNYRTLVVTHGPTFTLRVAHLLMRGASLVLLATTIAGIYPRAIFASAPLWIFADVSLARWRASEIEDGARAGRLIARLTLAGVATVIAAYGHHVWRIFHGVPAGGCGTEIVPEALLQICT